MLRWAFKLPPNFIAHLVISSSGLISNNLNKKTNVKNKIKVQMSTKDETMTASPNGQQNDVSNLLFGWLFPKYTKWKLLEVYYFNNSWYTVQVRQNVNTGYKQFKCKKFIGWHYGSSVKNLSVEGIEAILNGYLTQAK